MKKFSKTRQELLDNTVQFYSEDTTRRAYKEDANVCAYYVNGKACAIGRELKSPRLFQDEHGQEMVDKVFDYLPKRLQKLKVNFLKSIQFLHDSNENWDEYGLTGRGVEKVNEICKEYKLKNPLEN